MLPKIRKEVGVLGALAWPVVAAQLGAMMLGIVDTWMLGRLGTAELSAAALADVVLFGSLIFGIGLVMGIDPLVSQAHGGGEGERAGRALQRGIVLAVVASLPLALVWSFTGDLLILMGQEPHLAAMGQTYADANLVGLAPFLVFTALRQYLQGRGIMKAPLVIILVGNLANVLFNWVLIFGHLGFPAMGFWGAGLATSCTRIFMLVALVALILRRDLHRGAWEPWSRRALRLAPVLRYGLPVAIAFTLEVWAFSASTVLAGWLPGDAVASHIIVLKLASLSFMVPLGISAASATRVGNLLGASDRGAAQLAAWVALGMGGGVMLVNASIFVALRDRLGWIFSDDPEVVALSAAVFPVAAAFQLFDGTQAVGGGILRGMGNTRPAALFNLLGYYVLALPLAYFLAFRRGYGLPGIWWGLALGLAVVALLLVAFIAGRGPAKAPRLVIAD